jgi:predicted nucleic acid-binding Zn finger protein
MHRATQLLTRKQRGERITPQDIVQINQSSFFVKSQIGRSGYSVTRVGQDWMCDCPDFKFRQGKCKHIFAVESANAKSTLKWKFSLNLWKMP